MKLDRKIFAAAVAASLCVSGQLFADDKSTQTQTGGAAATQSEKPEHKFVHEAAKGGLIEVQMGKLAAQKGQSSSVKQFGDRLMRDHQDANNKLKKIAQKKGITVPQQLEQKDQKMIEHLQSLSGKEFDTAFIQHAVENHQKDIKKYEQQASEGEDPAIRSFASETLPVLREHQRIAQTLADNPNASVPELREPAGAEKKSSDAEQDDSDDASENESESQSQSEQSTTQP